MEKVCLYVACFTCIVVVSGVVLAWNSRNAPMLEWGDVSQLPAMEDSAMGVSSEVVPESAAYIEPFICRGHTQFALDSLEEVLRADKSFRYVRRNSKQIQAVAISTVLGFNNDLVFQARSNPERLEVYATSRISIGDLGSNRDQLEALRERLREMHVLK
ncbi:DUF1499 domain-containing protein [Cerasicoccus frondis]|uniref:DUF1499 domain-containing protein n=1 Tax=Cerasicoccus frondis TaxID=490090 RepID=UPI0028528256|nr:DUF1499 domain-containing protein [Cerasicoccus frondis]